MITEANTVKIQLNNAFKLHLVARKQEGRYAMHLIKVCPKEGHMIATNSTILASVPFEPIEDGPNPFLMPSTVLKESTKRASLPSILEIEDSIVLRKNDTKTDFGKPDREQQFPRTKDILSAVSGEPLLELTLNPKMLLDLAKAIGSDEAITLSLFTKRSAIKVVAAGNAKGNECVGAIMPMTYDGDTPKDWPTI